MRFIEAFSDMRIEPWPFTGPIKIEEHHSSSKRGDVIIVDNWCLLQTFTYDEFGTDNLRDYEPAFDHNIYKILRRYLLTKNGTTIQHYKNISAA